jgi:hypothetical protein
MYCPQKKMLYFAVGDVYLTCLSSVQNSDNIQDLLDLVMDSSHNIQRPDYLLAGFVSSQVTPGVVNIHMRTVRYVRIYIHTYTRTNVVISF